MAFKSVAALNPTSVSETTLTSCPVNTTLDVIGGKWKALILYQLRFGPRRFNELRRLLPTATQRMLTAHLRELEKDGVVSRKIFPVIPPHVEYSLTALGGTLLPILSAMADWGRTNAGLRRTAGGEEKGAA